MSVSVRCMINRTKNHNDGKFPVLFIGHLNSHGHLPWADIKEDKNQDQ